MRTLHQPGSQRNRTGRTLVLTVKWISAIAAVVTGVGVVVLAAAVGHCSAFGGTCPRPSHLDWDVFGAAAMGAALAAGVPVFVAQPSQRRFLFALGIAAAAGASVGSVVMLATAG